MTARSCPSCRWSVGVDCTRPDALPEAWLAANEVGGVLREGASGCPGYELPTARDRCVALVAAEPGLTTAEIAARTMLRIGNLAQRMRAWGLVARRVSERRPGAAGRGSASTICRWYPAAQGGVTDPAAGHSAEPAGVGGDIPAPPEPEPSSASPEVGGRAPASADGLVVECLQCARPSDRPTADICSGCDEQNRRDEARQAVLVAEGHTAHCAARQTWGDGECECRRRLLVELVRWLDGLHPTARAALSEHDRTALLDLADRLPA